MLECRKVRSKNYKKCFFCTKKRQLFQDCSFCDGCDQKEYKQITPLRKRSNAKRAKAVSISQSVKKTVYARDCGFCIFCGASGLPEAHIVPRSAGGLGIEQNVVTVCRECHRLLDQSTSRGSLKTFASEYLEKFYGEIKLKDVVYRKGVEI